MFKIKKLLSAVLMAILICIASGMAVTASAAEPITPTQPTNGDGTSSNPYQISNAEELYWFAGLVNGTLDDVDKNISANAKLTADITVNTNVLSASGTLNSGDYKQWTPIGDSTNEYSGTFDGQGHTISGLYCNVDLEYVGLFGYLDSNGTIKNIGVADSYFYSSFNGFPYIGGMCGYSKGTINSCYVSASMLYLNNAVNGGVVGINDNSSIKNCCYNSNFHSGNFMGNGNPNVTNVSGKTTAEFASGAATWLLNGNSSEGAWGQMLTGENKDAYPTAHTDSNTVCYNASKNQYVNKCADDKHTNLEETNGICPDCGFSDNKPKLTNDKYDINGDGKKDEVYEISNAGQLYWFAGLVNGTLDDVDKNISANAVLTKSFSVNKAVFDESGNIKTDLTAWTPIGDDNHNYRYSGTFDGQGHTISGLYFDNSNKDYVGLFGAIDINGKVLNVGVTDSYFRAGQNVGGICGKNIGTVTKCYNFSEITGKNDVGGICGQNYGGTITNCYNIAKITGSGDVGGICGWNRVNYDNNNNGTITNCYSSAEIICSNSDVGGICGYNVGKAIIENSYYNSSIYSGGCIGFGTITYTNNPAKTTAEFASGEVAWLLNGSTSEGDNIAWGQKLGDNADQYPVFRNASNTVYVTTKCVTYTNDSALSGKEKEHGKFSDDGFCTVCELGYQPAELKNGVYEISNAGQLYSFAQLVNSGTANTSDAILKADITVNTNVLSASGTLNSGNYKQWTPIGDSTNKYSGTFNGQGHTISGLYYDGADVQYVGLFGYLDSNGTIKNVGVADSYLYPTYRASTSYVGGLCGYSMGTINSCYASIKVNNNFGPSCAIAFSGGGTLTNCCNNSDFCDNIYLGEGKPTIKNNYGKTTAEFASGAVAWLLNGSTSEGVWKQTLTGDKPDAYPTFEGNTVYQQASGNTYANSLITTAKITADAPSFDENTTMYDKDGKEVEFAYDENADVTTVYVKIDGAEADVKPMITVSKGTDDEVKSTTWTAVNNIYYAQFIGDFADFGTIEVTYEGADSVTIPTTTSTEEEL